jgi:hypothetical protein
MPLLWLNVVGHSFDKHFGRLLLPGKTKIFASARNETGSGSVYSEESTFEGGVVSCTSLPTSPIFQLTHSYEKPHE